ncbi:cilia- and flagella-associated protein 410-like [Sycon ciliatum]|uniref:cilia- and flagella-associated protein 410-like n=1 Tax=Sycon ciliatum TaxID=27933 RepID=UPI0020AD0E7F
MVALTEKTALGRARAKSLDAVVRLNLWNARLTDLSILRQMPNLEVLSLSVNNVDSLKDIASCTKLRELYVRKNNVQSLDELQHLRTLLCLRVLWLSENPCAEDDDYRLKTIQMLPQLHFLDNVAIEDEEREDASSAALNDSQLSSSGFGAGSNQTDGRLPQPVAAASSQATIASSKENHVLSAVLTLLNTLDVDSLQTVVMKAQNQLETTQRLSSGVGTATKDVGALLRPTPATGVNANSQVVSSRAVDTD